MSRELHRQQEFLAPDLAGVDRPHAVDECHIRILCVAIDDLHIGGIAAFKAARSFRLCIRPVLR